MNVAYFASQADADARNPFRVEVWREGPFTRNDNKLLADAFNSGLWTWQQYTAATWFTGDLNDPTNDQNGGREAFFIGDYQPMKNGVVRVSVWTFSPNFYTVANGSADATQSDIGLRVGAAANQSRQTYIDIPYDMVTV